MRGWFLAISLAACEGGPKPPPPVAVGSATMPAPADAAIAAEPPILVDAAGPNPKACPPSYPKTGSCKGADRCVYADGTCDCGIPPHCGGDEPGERYWNQPHTWQCLPKTRADGCPGLQPNDREPCDRDGAKCDYTCSCMVTATCTHGAWHIAMGSCKP